MNNKDYNSINDEALSFDNDKELGAKNTIKRLGFITGARQFADLSQAKFQHNYPDISLAELKKLEKLPLKDKNVELKDKALANTGLDSVELSFICGTLLGDSSMNIDKGNANARMQYRHSTRQTEWFMWKTLGPLLPFKGDRRIQFQKPDGYQKEGNAGETFGKWQFKTLTSEKLTKVYHVLYPRKVKTIKRSWLNHMSNYFLMALWLDDGSLNNARQGVISCNSTPFAQAEELAQYISVVWGAKCKAIIVDTKKTGTNVEPSEIRFDNLDELERFLSIIAPLVPVKSMIYKVCLYTENMDGVRLQRWTTELKKLVREDFHLEIDLYYAYLKAIREQNKEI